jgi:hypothetical protein
MSKRRTRADDPSPQAADDDFVRILASLMTDVRLGDAASIRPSAASFSATREDIERLESVRYHIVQMAQHGDYPACELTPHGSRLRLVSPDAMTPLPFELYFQMEHGWFVLHAPDGSARRFATAPDAAREGVMAYQAQRAHLRASRLQALRSSFATNPLRVPSYMPEGDSQRPSRRIRREDD